MPDLPQHFPLTKLTASDLASVERWGSSLTQQLIREWTLLVQTVNALSRVDLAANRPATPGLDHIFFTESDGSQTTYVAVNGAWRALTSGGAGSPGATGPAVYLDAEGLEGEPGPPGPLGPAGATGSAGTTGSQGPTGPAVFLEADAIEGEIGPPGPVGATGQVGTTGIQGPIGPAVFLDAESGDEGAIGPPGPQGLTGAGGLTLTPFTKDLGVANYAGTFDITGLSGLTTDKPVAVVQTAAAIASKGNARDEFEMDQITLTGYVLNSTTIRAYWHAPSIVVGTYAFAHQVSG